MRPVWSSVGFIVIHMPANGLVVPGAVRPNAHIAAVTPDQCALALLLGVGHGYHCRVFIVGIPVGLHSKQQGRVARQAIRVIQDEAARKVASWKDRATRALGVAGLVALQGRSQVTRLLDNGRRQVGGGHQVQGQDMRQPLLVGQVAGRAGATVQQGEGQPVARGAAILCPAGRGSPGPDHGVGVVMVAAGHSQMLDAGEAAAPALRLHPEVGGIPVAALPADLQPAPVAGDAEVHQLEMRQGVGDTDAGAAAASGNGIVYRRLRRQDAGGDGVPVLNYLWQGQAGQFQRQVAVCTLKRQLVGAWQNKAVRA